MQAKDIVLNMIFSENSHRQWTTAAKAYLPCEIEGNTTLHEALGWTTEPDTAQEIFQERYCKVIACWARRYGSLLKGWWFDGCYTWSV